MTKTYSEFLIELSLGAAGAFAAKAHDGQHRKSSGAPYIVHPMGVVRILQKVGVKDKNVLVAAWLHDSIEDSNTTYNDLKKEFNKEIADLVKEVTSIKKDLDKVGKPLYLAKKMVGMSNGALAIKLSDMVQNTSDLSQMPAKKALQQATLRQFILDHLIKHRNLNKIHKKLIKMVRKNLAKVH